MQLRYLTSLSEHLSAGSEIAPLLFVYHNVDTWYEEIHTDIQYIFKIHELDPYSLYTLSRYDKEAHKIKNVREFISQAHIQARQKFQFFVFEDFSRLTPQSQNACLKFFEEPGVGNIIIIHTASLVGVLETIQSRVQILYQESQSTYKEHEDFRVLIQKALSGDKSSLLAYFFKNTCERQQYANFLTQLLHTLADTGKYHPFFETLAQDIQKIQQTNVPAKNIVDLYIMNL